MSSLTFFGEFTAKIVNNVCDIAVKPLKNPPSHAILVRLLTMSDALTALK
ncbi:MAG: hypothetical protein FWG08_02905 [Propionibacteriaceae bacterium]|nr:hypothetical protein [Propionibacteriaceae bacterium]